MSNWSDGLVETTAGVVQGERAGDVRSFKGIPYAAAPVQVLRFAAPEPVKPWPGVCDATQYGPISLQHLDPLSAMIPGCEWNFYHPGARQDEDCLNLNVWSAAASADERRPVLVWIHGGAFLAGSGTGLWSDGIRLAAEQGLVVVTINYRLGALGGLAVDDQAQSSNTMLRDQVRALQWVRDNISAFGGDPERVTIAGESAGAMSVVLLLAAPSARGLFHAAIAQSGHASISSPIERALVARDRYLAELGIADDCDPLTVLRELPASRLMDAQAVLAGQIIVPFRPAVDGTFLPAAALSIYQDSAQAKVPLLIGTNTDEHNLFAAMAWGPGATQGPLQERIAGLFDPSDTVVVDELTATYRQLGDDDAAWNALTTDRDWRGPVRDLATAHAASGAEVYSYEFSYRSTALGGRLRACHALDIPFVFGNLAQRGVSEFVGDDPEQQPVREQAEHAFVEAWGAFVRDHRPAASNLPAWPRYEPQSPVVMAIGTEPGPRADPHGARLDRWTQLHPTAGLLGL